MFGSIVGWFSQARTLGGLAAEPLTIVHVDAETSFSGGEVQVFLLMEGLRARGHRNVLVCPGGSAAAREASARGIEVRAVSMRSDLDLAAVIGLKREFTSAEADIAHLHTGRATWLGSLAAKRTGIPAISTRRMDRRVKRGWRTRRIYGQLARVAAISPAVRQRLIDGGVPAEKVSVIWSSVDPAGLEVHAVREDTRRTLGITDERTVALTLCSLVERKGIDVLLNALVLQPDLSLWIGGDGPERSKLEALAASLNLSSRVQFLGQRADKADLLDACDLFVLPSRAEGLGVAALEAMALGRAVVASSVGGLGEVVVHGETGRLVAPEDPDALAGALGELVQDAELRARLGEAGAERVRQHFLAERMVHDYEKLYREVLQ